MVTDKLKCPNKDVKWLRDPKEFDILKHIAIRGFEKTCRYFNMLPE